MDAEIEKLFALFSDDTPIAAQRIDTSRGDADFRATFLVETASGGKFVLKLADNDFTFPGKIAVWQRTVEDDSHGWSSRDAAVRPMPRSMRPTIRWRTGFRRTSGRTKRCMKGIGGTFGG